MSSQPHDSARWNFTHAAAFRRILSAFVAFLSPVVASFSVYAQAPKQQDVYAGVPLTSSTSEIVGFSKDSTSGSSLIEPTPGNQTDLDLEKKGRGLRRARQFFNC